MKKTNRLTNYLERFIDRLGLGMRAKLIIIFLLVKVIPLILLAVIAWRQVTEQGDVLRNIAVEDSSAALNDSAVENIERMSTDAAARVAAFLYGRDDDIRYLAGIEPTEENFRRFIEGKRGRVIKKGRWELAPDGREWLAMDSPEPTGAGVSTNSENNDMNGFHPRPADNFLYDNLPLYDEITFIDVNGNELVKVLAADSPKVHYPLSPEKRNVATGENTYVKAESYFPALAGLKSGDIYVSDVIGAYVGSNYIGMYTPPVVAEAARARGYDIDFEPEKQAYAGEENPNGQRFEGIVRWASPVTDAGGKLLGYVTMALNHDHIMEFVDHITPMNERYIELPNAYEGNYAFIWDYNCRNIAHPRHHSIVGFNPETGGPQIPWLESSIYEGWKKSGLARWTDYVKDYPLFHEQSREKKPAMELTRLGLVGLDGRYLNNAPQCTGWMDLTLHGGSGSFYILWSGLYKLNTAAAIPYYTGQYAPSEANGYSRRGFGFVAIGSGLDFFTGPARETEEKLVTAISENLKGTFMQLTTTTVVLIVLVVFIAIWMASSLTNRITGLIKGISRFRAGERHYRFEAPVKDEFGTLADSFDEMADSLVDSVKQPLAIIDMDRNVIYMNQYALKLNKTTLADVIGTPYDESSIYPFGSEYCPVTALAEGREASIMYLEEQDIYVKGIANYFWNKQGEKSGYIIETHDVTEMVHRQQALEEAIKTANRANEHKGEFLARMSHEIRTPMNAIIGLSDIVIKSLNEAGGTSHSDLREVEEHVRQIEASSHHLLGLLNDILDISKIEAGKIALAEEKASLLQLADTVSSIIKPRCDEKRIEFRTDFIIASPSVFITDPLRLRQVLINLLGNSVKFTPAQGRIEFNIKRIDRREGESLMQFTVADNGIGISPEALAVIFQPFEQASGSITSQYGGTGLGLSISRHIVRIFGGEIAVKSEVGQGSEFTFSIWLREAGDDEVVEKEVADPTGKFVGKKVLLVDDVDLNRKIAKAMLKNTGIEIEEAEDGSEALRKFEESRENYYDLILMDVQMPIMNGYQASEAIRALPRADALKVPIIALTANAFTEDIEKASQAGMNAHIAKPVKPDKLAEALFNFLPVPGSDEEKE